MRQNAVLCGNGLMVQCSSLSAGNIFSALILPAKVNSLPNNKFIDWFKLKAFADDKINLNKKSEFVFGRVENIVGKGENAGNQHFLLFQQCFQKGSPLRTFKVGIVW